MNAETEGTEGSAELLGEGFYDIFNIKSTDAVVEAVSDALSVTAGASVSSPQEAKAAVCARSSSASRSEVFFIFLKFLLRSNLINFNLIF